MMGAVALAVGLTVCALPAWVRTGPGHRTVERVLTRLLNERIPGTVSVGRLSGDVISGLRAEPVTVRNPRGEVIGRADWMSARWRPLALLRRHQLEELTACRPVVMLDRGTWRTRPSGAPGAPSKNTTIEQIVAQDGRLTWKAATFEHVNGTARLRTRSNLDVRAISAQLGATRWTAYGVVGWGDAQRAWVATRFAIDHHGDVRGRGEVFYTPGRVEGEIDELTLSAPMATRLIGGRSPLRIRGRVEGAPGQLRALAHAAQDRRALTVRALIDGPRRVVSVDARLAGGPRPLRLHTRARIRGAVLVVPTFDAAIGDSRLVGSGVAGTRVLRSSMSLRLAPAEARLLGLRTTALVQARVELDGAPGALGIQARASLADSRILVRARCDVRARRGRARVVVDNLQLARVTAGAPPITVSATGSLDGHWVNHALVADVTVASGRMAVGSRTFDQLDGAGRVRLARRGDAMIERLSGRLGGDGSRPRLAVRGHLQWAPERIGLRGTTVSLADSRWTGDLTYVRQGAAGGPHVSARVAAMALSPELVAHVLRWRPPNAWVGRAEIDGAPADLSVQAEATTNLGRATLAGRLRRSDGALQLSGVEAHLGESQARGAVRFGRDRLTASLDELVLAPALVHELWPAVAPMWPLRIHGTVDGPLDALDLALRLDAGPSTADLRGQVAFPARRFRLVGHLDSFDLSVVGQSRARVRGTFDLAAGGRLAGGGVVGTLSVRNARGYLLESPFYRGLVEARVNGLAVDVTRARVEVPGAKLAGRGRGAYGKGFHFGYGLVITDALALRHLSKTLRVLIGLNGILPGRTVEGEIEKEPGEKVEFTYHVLPIGASQLVFLYRVITGGMPDLR
ncbi:MAG: hypothetical protein JWN44_2891 [Myxococcales bacterium]|nr:hypothetical protein [Myxococcales bacterium]